MEKTENQSAWKLMLLAAAILMITMGIRQSVGLFIYPLTMSTGLGIVSISFALAIGQFIWGLAQPIFGILADKKGSFAVLASGGILLAAGQLLTIWADSQWLLILSLGILGPFGAGAGSFSVLIGATSGRLPLKKRSFAGGFINAGGSFGQFVFAPLSQFLIGTFGWISAMVALAGSALLTIPLARSLCPPGAEIASRPVAKVEGEESMKETVLRACRNPSYLLLHAGFFTCGFHVAFLVTHLPGEVALGGHGATVSAVSLGIIGLFNIAGSLLAGTLGNYFKMKYILAVMYASRAIMIALFVLAPKTELVFYIFAAGTGFTWLATVPPTAGIVGKLFGTRYLATLFGLTLLTHQIGAFLGAWLGGVAVANEGSYLWVWYADIGLAALAAVVNLPIKEPDV